MSQQQPAEKPLLSGRLLKTKPSPSMVMMEIIAKLRKEGREIVSLTIGEPDLPTPDHIVSASIDALNNQDIRYTPPNGSAELRQAIADKFKFDNGLTYAPDELTLGAGAKQIIFAAIAATLNDDQEVIIPAPYWVSYPDIVELFNGKPVIVDCHQDSAFKLTAEQLASAITDKTRWLILNSPNNPTGSVYSHEDLVALGAVLEQHPDVLIMTDEIYEHFVFDDQPFTSFAQANPQLHSRTLTINGMSKAYGMTGFRLGFAGGPGWLIKGINQVISQDTSCPSSISQAATLAALTGDQSFLVAQRELFQKRRDILVQEINKIDGMRCDIPAGAFYAYVSVADLIGRQKPDGKNLESDIDVSSYLLNESGIATMAGAIYGLSPYLRLSLATSEETLLKSCKEMARAIDRLTTPSKS
ncbi:MAG: aminotransferase class I/II-fold pyridoxal phosphate-dependent enzyme [Porticoccaceae bacterium]|nr:aminotransferase class I/II-fold pyridoxal phosphate-dependent enzyme [Porticoccaceae bacterium]